MTSHFVLLKSANISFFALTSQVFLAKGNRLPPVIELLVEYSSELEEEVHCATQSLLLLENTFAYFGGVCRHHIYSHQPNYQYSYYTKSKIIG